MGSSTSNIAIPQLLPLGIFGDSFVLIIFLLVLAVYVVFTGVLYYHWTAYSNNLAMTTLTFILYFALTVPIMLTIGTSALFI